MDRLHELQQIDTAIAELQAELRALDDGSALRERLAREEEELTQRRAAYRDDHAVQSKKEGELAKAEEKRQALWGKAYGGTIANPKELETLDREIESLGRTKDRLENELLELFDKVDAQNQAVKEQERTVETLKSELAETVQSFERERARLTGEIGALKAEREGVTALIAPQSVQVYERIRDRCANLGVAVIEGRMCTACRVNLPVVQIARLTIGSDFEKCESCARLLWIEREPDTDADDSASPAD